jgi:pimeloyl-ACP methyl ester carboxylesterase
MRHLPLAVLLVAGVAITPIGGCDDGGGSDPPDAGGDGSPWPYPIDSIEATWHSCSLYEGEDDGLAECAAVEMPLDWSDEGNGRTFVVVAKRLLAATESDLQIWLLDGGPGAAGTYDFPPYMTYLQQLYPGADVYTLDHRGTGKSGRLSCPAAESPESAGGDQIDYGETFGCIPYLEETWGDALDYITTSSSAIDLAALIEASRRPDQRVIVWGGSYGSYFAHRYLQIFPDQADGVVIEAIFTPDGTFIDSDLHIDAVAHELFDRCADHALCADKLGDDPWGLLGSVLEAMRDGHCAVSGLSADLVRIVFAYALYSEKLAALLPAATYRLDRCEPEDATAVFNLYDFLFGEGGAWDIEAYSILLQHHVMFSEMWDHPDFEGVDLDAYFDDLYDTTSVAKLSMPTKKSIKEHWPAYEDPLYDDGWAEAGTPLLMLQGELDPVCPHVKALDMVDHFHGPNQHFVSFPHSCHGVSGASPYPSDEGLADCGQELMLAFMADPTAPLDASCADHTLPIDFDPDPELAEAVFGIADAYENGSSTKSSADPSARAELRRDLRARLERLGAPEQGAALLR